MSFLLSAQAVVLLSLASGLWLGQARPAAAQVVRDRTLPQSSRVNRTGNLLEITGGTQRGGNLFHSFERFSVPAGDTALFNNSTTVESIFARVTGRSVSRIDGALRANGSANLFLLNPNGILLGPNASLNIGGAFVASTAEQIRFRDGFLFSARTPLTTPLLTVSVPVGLQLGDSPGAILVQGPGHGLFLSSPENPAVDRSNRTLGLAVAPGQRLVLVGGDLTLEGGNLTAAGGQIELGSVAAGEVTLEPEGRLGYAGAEAFGEIVLRQAASLEASGSSGGAIRMRGRQIQITGTSALLADTLGDGRGGSLDLRATEQIRVAGFAFPEGRNPFVSRLSTDVAPGATGQGGSVTITTPRLQIENGAQISSGTFGPGNAGRLLVQTEDLAISGGSPVGPSGLFAPVEATASGRGGQLTVSANRLQMAGGGQIAVSTFGPGNAGSLAVRAGQVELQGRGTGLFATVEAGTSGNGGELRLVAARVQLRDGAQIATSTAGVGNAGDLSVRAGQLQLDGASGSFASGLAASVEPEATGQGGSLIVVAEQLRLTDGAQISTATFGAGDGGNLTLQVETITVSGSSSQFPSALFADSSGSGSSGNLAIRTEELRLADGGQIGTATAGAGDAGNLSIVASDVELTGQTPFGRSGLFASAIAGSGRGGNLSVTTDRLTVQDGATISVSNFSSADPSRPPGRGGVGNIAVNARQILLDNQAILTADSAAGDRGNIALTADLLLLRRQSVVSTNAVGNARGGNIEIDADILAATGNSDITANATNNFGGSVTIAADGVLGTQVRPQLTPASDITASSELGAEFSGSVELNASDVDPDSGLVALPTDLIDASNQIAAVCAETEGNVFVVTGRGGLPEAPSQLLRGETVWEDLRTVAAASPENSQAAAAQPAANAPALIEAQSWQRTAAGQIMLVAAAPARLPDSGCTAFPRKSP